MAIYRVLEKDEVKGEGFEIRKYPPSKRTISICNRTYFLSLPYVVFGFFKNPKFTCLATAFAKDSESIFFPPLPNVYNNYIVCLGGGAHNDNWTSHFSHSPHHTIEDLISRFWQSDFHSIDEWTDAEDALFSNYRSFHDWAKLSPDQVIEKLRFGEKDWVHFFDAVVDGLRFAQNYG